jgi:hypothetical protein
MTLQTFTDAYLEAMFFTDIDNPDLEDDFGVIEGLSPTAHLAVEIDCAAFWEKASILSPFCTTELDPTDQMGHDFWLTRNGHGAGFWETEDWQETAGEILTELCKVFGPMEVYKGDDDLIYISGRE